MALGYYEIVSKDFRENISNAYLINVSVDELELYLVQAQMHERILWDVSNQLQYRLSPLTHSLWTFPDTYDHKHPPKLDTLHHDF